MLMMVVVGLAINVLWANSNVLGTSSDYSDTSLLNNTNAARAADNETALSIDPQLSAAAQAKANDMVSRNYWAHNTPDGKTPWTFIEAAGYNYQLAGENLAYGFNNAADAVTGWMNSPEHRANILNTGYSQVGFGVASSPNYQGKGPETVVVAEYGQPAAAAANITFTVPPAAGTAGAKDVLASRSEPATQLVSRIQLLTGGRAQWSLFAVSLLGSAAVLTFILRHGLGLRRVLVRSEVFITRHPMLDMLVVFFATAGFVLSRSSGFIR